MDFIRFDTGSYLYNLELELRYKVLREPLKLKFTPEFLEADEDDSHFCLLDNNGKMVACLLIKKLSGSKVKLRQMAVSESERGRGLGRSLILKTETLLKKEGIRKIELHARKYAEGFYLKSGYESVGSEFIEIGIPHVKMEKFI